MIKPLTGRLVVLGRIVKERSLGLDHHVLLNIFGGPPNVLENHVPQNTSGLNDLLHNVSAINLDYVPSFSIILMSFKMQFVCHNLPSIETYFRLIDYFCLCLYCQRKILEDSIFTIPVICNYYNFRFEVSFSCRGGVG